MIDEKVDNSELVNLNGTILNVPVSKSVITVMALIILVLLCWIKVDITDVTSLLVSFSLSVGCVSISYVFATTLYTQDHLTVRAMFEFHFKSKIKSYDIKLEALDNIRKK